MRRTFVTVLASLLVVSPVLADNGLAVRESPHSVAKTEAQLLTALEARGMKVFVRIDHAAGAKEAGMELTPTRLVLFGNPKLGTRLMQCGHTAAIDLPMSMLIWQEGDAVRVAYNTPAWLDARHGLADCKPVLAKAAKALEGFAAAAVKE